MAKFFIDAVTGKYIGAFEGSIPPSSVEVDSPPADARMEWKDSEWKIPADVKDQMIASQRRDAYDRVGASMNAMVIALWEHVIENNPTAAAELQAKREQIKNDIK